MIFSYTKSHCFILQTIIKLVNFIIYVRIHEVCWTIFWKFRKLQSYFFFHEWINKVKTIKKVNIRAGIFLLFVFYVDLNIWRSHFLDSLKRTQTGYPREKYTNPFWKQSRFFFKLAAFRDWRAVFRRRDQFMFHDLIKHFSKNINSINVALL